MTIALGDSQCRHYYECSVCHRPHHSTMCSTCTVCRHSRSCFRLHRHACWLTVVTCSFCHFITFLIPFGFFQFAACFFTAALFRAFFICLSPILTSPSLKPHSSPSVPPMSPQLLSPQQSHKATFQFLPQNSTITPPLPPISISCLVSGEASQLVSSPLKYLVSRSRQHTRSLPY